MYVLPGVAVVLSLYRQSFEAVPDTARAAAIGELAAGISFACCVELADMPGRIRLALARAAADPALLGEADRRPQAEGYARRVIYADPAGRFTILAIVWAAGQFSPAHAHHTWCAYAVYDGELEETLFRWNPASEVAEPLRTQGRSSGYSCFAEAGLDQIHSLGNSSAHPAISIHVYGVERERITTHVNRLVDSAR
jgi:predicted metal-dependent enzyme (double-stranded beta helix superfamily)